MLKKIPPYIFAVFAALSLTLIPAPNALAWNQVCLHVSLWESDISADFYVAHGFDPVAGQVPHAVRNKRLNFVPGSSEVDRAQAARHEITRGDDVNRGEDGCVSISGIAEGEAFFVYGNAVVYNYYARPQRSNQHFFCPGEQDQWSIQNGQPGILWYKITGLWNSPQCLFTGDRRDTGPASQPHASQIREELDRKNEEARDKQNERSERRKNERRRKDGRGRR